MSPVCSVLRGGLRVAIGVEFAEQSDVVAAMLPGSPGIRCRRPQKFGRQNGNDRGGKVPPSPITELRERRRCSTASMHGTTGKVLPPTSAGQRISRVAHDHDEASELRSSSANGGNQTKDRLFSPITPDQPRPGGGRRRVRRSPAAVVPGFDKGRDRSEGVRGTPRTTAPRSSRRNLPSWISSRPPEPETLSRSFAYQNDCTRPLPAGHT